MTSYRIGYGEDAHRLAPGRRLIIGGLELESPHGAVAHSDGDVLLHALADALLSAFALGDIGHYFPPSDPAFKDLDSREIVTRVRSLLEARVKKVSLVNVAAVVTLDAPKLGSKREAIQASLARLLELPLTSIGLTFKTSEGLAPEHVQARVSVLVEAQ